jgi:hypothetical protein
MRIAMSVIHGLYAGHRVVENTFGNFETDAKARQTRAKRAAQIVQAHATPLRGERVRLVDAGSLASCRRV